MVTLMSEFGDLVKLLPNGAATVSVILVVILFLKQQEKMNVILEQITNKFNEQTAANQKSYQDQITALSSQYYTNQQAFQNQIQSLIDAHLKISRETISALKSLEATVNVVKEKVAQLPPPKP